MSYNMIEDDMERHRDWLDAQIEERKRKVIRWNQGTDQRTYVIRLSGGQEFNSKEWASVLKNVANLTVEPAFGTWDGEVEQGVTITVQANFLAIDDILRKVQSVDPELNWIHVEEHEPRTWYVSLKGETDA